MKQDVFDILLYLFENYMYEENELEHDRDSLQIELQDAGFRKHEISKAFDWLEGLGTIDYDGETKGSGTQSFRIYSDDEMAKLDSECRGFLLFLEQMGVLDQATREMVIDRVMALDNSDEVELDQLKWVILMVLFNQPGQEAAVAWMEDLVLDEVVAQIH
jgi:Smg protein